MEGGKKEKTNPIPDWSASVMASLFFRMNGTKSSAEREREVGGLSGLEKGRK